MTAKASNHKDTYRATAVFLALMGILYLVDRLIGFASHGLPWVMQKRCCSMRRLFSFGLRRTSR